MQLLDSAGGCINPCSSGVGRQTGAREQKPGFLLAFAGFCLVYEPRTALEWYWKLSRVVDKPAAVAAYIMQLQYSLFFARCRPGAHHNNKGLSACGTTTLWRPRCSREPRKTAKSSEWRAAKTRHRPNPFNGDHPKQTLIPTRPSHRPHAMWMPSLGFALKMIILLFTSVRW